MSLSPANPWQALLASDSPGADTAVITCRGLSKRGRPLLLLPNAPALARQALALYPAQSAKARLAKAGLQLALKLGVFPSAQREEIRLATRVPFAEFLRTAAGTANFPNFAALAGNPFTTGARQLFLLFDTAGRPKAIIKAGLGGPAAALIDAEISALRALPAGTPGAPVIRAEFRSAALHAFALDFYAGQAPRANDTGAPLELLRAWIQPGDERPLMQLPAWQRLAAASAGDDRSACWQTELASARVRPAIWHGDFAPWNIKVAPSSAGSSSGWRVLDWERSELEGVPGWDWFHFVVQPELLVRRAAPEQSAARLRNFLASPPFQAYACAAGIAGLEEPLLAAYLAYMVRVVRPSEGLAATEQVLEIIASTPPTCRVEAG